MLGTVACAAAPNAALSGVAGTGVTYPPEPDPRELVEYGCEKAEATEVIVVLMGFGKDGAPPAVIVGLFKNFGGCVRDVKDGSEEGGPITPGLFDVRWDQGESLIARLASLTVLWSGFINCFTSGLRSPMFRPSVVLVDANSPHA